MADRNDAVTMSLEEAKILVMRGMAGQSPRINPTNNHWEVYDNESGDWKDTGVDASGNVDVTGDNQLVFLNYDGDTMRVTNAETGESITAAQIGALTTQGKMAFLYADINVPEWLAFNGWYPNTGEAVFDNDKFRVVVTTNLQTLVTTGLLTVKPWLPEVTIEDAGKILKVNSGGAWAAAEESGGTGLPSYSSANPGNVLKLYRPSANSGNAMTWGSPVYQIPVSLNAGVYTVASGVTAEDIVSNKGSLVIILNGSIEYDCVGALTSDFLYGHFYFVAAKPSNSKIETEWLDLAFFTGDVNESSVSVTPVSFDIKGTKWISVQYNPSTGSYTPNFTAADVVNGLPNAVLTLGESRYIPVGWETDEGYLVNATFARASYDSTGFAGFDCFKVNNTDGSFTVQRYTIPAGGTSEMLIYTQWDSSTSTYKVKVYNSRGILVDATYDDLYDHRNNLWLNDRLPVDFITTSGDLVAGHPDFTCFFTERLVYSDRVEYTQWKIAASSDGLDVTRTTKTLT